MKFVYHVYFLPIACRLSPSAVFLSSNVITDLHPNIYFGFEHLEDIDIDRDRDLYQCLLQTLSRPNCKIYHSWNCVQK